MKKEITIIFCLLVSATMMGQDCLTFMGAHNENTERGIFEKILFLFAR